jgi:hypothetical protein
MIWRRISWFAAGLLLLLLITYFGLQAWIESSGGRTAVEEQLSLAAGKRVRLGGEFDVVFLPVPGVRGTQLEITDPQSGQRVAHSRDYAAALSLPALAQKRLLVDHLEMTWLTFGPEGGQRLAIPRVTLSGFEPGSLSRFAVDLGPLGEIDGEFTWRPDSFNVDLALDGALEAVGPFALGGRFFYNAEGASFDGLELSVAGQELEGSGCYHAAGEAELNLDLRAARLDLDALEALAGGRAGGGRLPLVVNLRLHADEMVRGEVTAFDAVFEYGSAFACH